MQIDLHIALSELSELLAKEEEKFLNTHASIRANNLDSGAKDGVFIILKNKSDVVWPTAQPYNRGILLTLVERLGKALGGASCAHAMLTQLSNAWGEPIGATIPRTIQSSIGIIYKDYIIVFADYYVAEQWKSLVWMKDEFRFEPHKEIKPKSVIEALCDPRPLDVMERHDHQVVAELDVEYEQTTGKFVEHVQQPKQLFTLEELEELALHCAQESYSEEDWRKQNIILNSLLSEINPVRGIWNLTIEELCIHAWDEADGRQPPRLSPLAFYNNVYRILTKTSVGKPGMFDLNEMCNDIDKTMETTQLVIDAIDPTNEKVRRFPEAPRTFLALVATLYLQANVFKSTTNETIPDILDEILDALFGKTYLNGGFEVSELLTIKLEDTPFPHILDKVTSSSEFKNESGEQHLDIMSALKANRHKSDYSLDTLLSKELGMKKIK